MREELVKCVLKVKRVSDRLMTMKVEVKGLILNRVSVYAPQVDISMKKKNNFWQDLDGLIESVSKQKMIFLGADQNGHVRKRYIGDEQVMGRYGAGTKNKEGRIVVGFSQRMDLAVANTYFKTKDEHRVTYRSGGKISK